MDLYVCVHTPVYIRHIYVCFILRIIALKELIEMGPALMSDFPVRIAPC